MPRFTQGFTLIETFVAITVLAIAIVGPLTIASRGLNSTLISRDQLVATYLAQEAIEHVRYVKDSNVLRGEGWLSGTISACQAALGCTIDVWSTPTIQGCSSSGCPALRYNDDQGKYSYSSSGVATSFVRTVRIQNVSSDEQIVNVQVSWRSGAATRTIEISERIFNWAGGIVADQTP